MIPSIESIVEMLIAGECTAQEAISWIAQHFENSELRDHFAGQALIGWREDEGATYDEAAVAAYEMADEMLRARAA